MRVDADRGTIARGKAADLVLIEGRPYERIDDIERIRAVYVAGREVDRDRLRAGIASPGVAPLPAEPAGAAIDDFEQEGDRSTPGQLWLNYADSGLDRSRAMWTRGFRAPGNHTLLIQSRMGHKDRAYTQMVLPLADGGMVPVDVRRYRGVRFDARGEGRPYRLVVWTRDVRDGAWFGAPFAAGPAWGTVRIDFSQLVREKARSDAKWSGDDLLALGFEISRPGGERGWLELDNLAFFE